MCKIKKCLSVFFVFTFIILSPSFIKSDYFDDAKKIRWESVYEPFFNRYYPFGTGARAIGMGEAFSAIADDASAVYYNPAGIAQLDHNEIFWTSGSYYKTMPFTGFFSFIMALGNQYFGLSYMRLYHPVGRYPDKVEIPAPGVNTGPGSLFYDPTSTFFIGAGYRENWYGDFTAAEQAFLGEKYRTFINRNFQEGQVALTYSTPLTADRSFLFGLNVKYMFSDAEYKDFYKNYNPAIPRDEYDAWAWSLDVGFMYKLRIIEFLKDFNIAIMLRDVSGRMKRISTGQEESLYFTSALGLSMRTTELIQNEITSFSIDWNAVNDPKVFQAEKNRMRFGVEQWLLDGHFGLRGGLVYFMYPGPWRLSLGASARYWLGIDYAYCTGLKFGDKAEEESDSHWVSIYWMWGKVKRKLPTPEVSAAVEPISFAPKNGELATFKLSASSEAGIDRWVLNILDKNNNLVKSYIDIGMPPSQIIWNGTDNKYQLLPDGEYIFVFEATDKLGSTSSTPVQTIKIYTPVLPAVNKEALNQLKALLNQIKERDVREDDAEAALARSNIEKLKKEKAKPTPVPPPGPETLPGYGTTAVVPGILPQQVTATAATGPVSIVGFPNVESGAIRAAYLETRQDGTKLFNVDYVTENTIPKYVLKEMALMVRSIAESLAESSAYTINQVGINALMAGGGTMSLMVPAAQAQNYSRGLITDEQLLRGSSIRLNGEIIYPNF
ncbi:MAG: hypothetical protein N3E50_05115 [Candidatus Goldbacteria bacterium]|nr:hypothetical protein [Candidatus Goldiibacteriota bacterium]